MNANYIFLATISLVMIIIFLFQIYKIHKMKFTHQHLSMRYVSITIGVIFVITTIIISQNVYHYLVGLSTALNFFVVSFNTGISENGFVYRPNRAGIAGLVPTELKYEKLNKVLIEKNPDKVVVIFNSGSVERTFEFAGNQYKEIRKFLEAKPITVKE